MRNRSCPTESRASGWTSTVVPNTSNASAISGSQPGALTGTHRPQRH
jgi:hypothetical protein